MDQWNEYAYPAIVSIAKNDKIYLELLTENNDLEKKYMKILEMLTEDEKEAVDRYVASCESIEFRFAQLAYRFGLLQNI